MPNSSFNLSNLNGTNGFRIQGIDLGDLTSYSVSGAGDVNNDGFADLIIGAPGADPNGIYSGESYVVFGGTTVGSGGNLDLLNLDGTNGFIINGTDQNDLLGWSVSGAGDINGDGFADLILGASGADPNGNSVAGKTYVIFGSRNLGSGGSINLSDLNGSNGFVINGIAPLDGSGWSVSGAEDINGDGFADLIIGAPGSQVIVPGSTNARSGENYVVFGGTTVGAGGSLNLSDLNGSNGFTLNGLEVGDASDFSVSGAGDINGDGFADLIIGTAGIYLNRGFGTSTFPGKSYVVFGGTNLGADGSVNLSNLNGNNGFEINGLNADDRLGYSVSSAGDINGDGFADLIIGAPGADPNGESYVVFGGTTLGTGGIVNLSNLDGSNGFRIAGIDAVGFSGHSISGAGDINGDGIDDLLVGGPGADPNGNYSGESYVVFGRTTVGAGGSLDVSAINGNNGFIINGIIDVIDYSGISVSDAGDINGDGIADLVLGAPGPNPDNPFSHYPISNSPGNSYVVFGSRAFGIQPLGSDFNSDGQSDILWRNSATGENAVWLMNGTNLTGGVLTTPVTDPNWDISGTGDFDSDGQTDLLWRNGATGENAVWLMNGTDLTQGVSITPVADLNWNIGGTGDFDSDGQTDILWRNGATGENAVWLMNGTDLSEGVFITPVADPNWDIGGTGDFDSDGQTDILWRNGATGENAVWLMNGTDLSEGVFITPVADLNWDIGGTGDFDNDSQTDILWRNGATGENAVWLMNGTDLDEGVFTTSVADLNWQIVA